MEKVSSGMILFGMILVSCYSIPKTEATSIANSPESTLSSNVLEVSPDDPSAHNFSLDNINSISPEDVTIEVVYLPHGGPGDAGYCRDENGEPVHYSVPLIVEDPTDNELMVMSTFATCGWEKNQTISAMVEYPDGRTKQSSLTIDEAGAAVLSFAPNLDDPKGVYVFKIFNTRFTLESNAYFYVPNVPRLYYLNENQILFHKFPSNKPVQLVLFSNYSGGDQKADGGTSFVIGDTGELVVTIPDEPNSLYAGVVDSLIYTPIDNVGTSHSGLLGKYNQVTVTFSLGSDSGIEYLEKRRDFEARAISYRSCTNTTNSNFLPISGFQDKDHFVKVISSGVDIYAQPRYSARKLQSLEEGQPLILLDGPYCFDNAIWWSVALPNDYKLFYGYGSGYIAEFDLQNKNYLEKQDCGNLPSRLSFLDWARVAFSNGNDKRIRKEPGFSADILTTIPEGTQIRISSNSWCMDSTPWFLVETLDRTQGWMTEIQDDVYFLEPAPN